MARKRYVVIGEGAAGLTAAQELRRLEPHAAIGLFTDEPHPSYFRAALTNFLLGELRDDQLWFCPPDFYDTHSIRRAFARVVRVDPQRGELWDTSSSEPTPFDALLVASGARPRPPPFPGGLLPGVVTLRTLHDARLLMDWLRLGQLERAVVLGGGPLGLEWAHALRERGLPVTLVERGARLMPRALDEVASDLLAARLRKAGIEVVFGAEVVQAFPGAHGGVAGVVLSNGQRLDANLVAAALGIVPNSECLRDSGVRLNERGAVVVDRNLASSAPNVWAAGDVASVDGESLGLWEPARRQGRLAAQNMTGSALSYQPGAHYFATRLFDLDFAKVGDIERAPGREEVVHFPRGTGTIAYRRLVLENGRLVGALMLGERAERVRKSGRALKRLIDARADIRAIQQQILSANFDLDAWLAAHKLMERPIEPAARPASPPPAKVRGTQILHLPTGGGTAAVPSLALAARGTSLLRSARAPSGPSSTRAIAPPRATRVLSIGLQAEAPPQLALAVPTDAFVEARGQPFRIGRAVTSLGQASDADLRVSGAGVGGLHAQIAEHGGAFYLRDLGSHAGTFVNGAPLTNTHRLSDGDRIQVGAEALVFRSPGAARRAEQTSSRVPAPRLIVRSGTQFGLAVRLASDGLLIGQGARARLRLSDAGVADEHALIRSDGARFWVEALTAAAATTLRGQPLAPGRAEALAEGDVVRLGPVELVFSEAPVEDAARALAPNGRLRVDSGRDAGRSIAIVGVTRVGSHPEATFVLGGIAPLQLEVTLHGRAFWVRDTSGGQTFRAGRSLGAEWAALESGDLLLLGQSGVLLRFEEE